MKRKPLRKVKKVSSNHTARKIGKVSKTESTDCRDDVNCHLDVGTVSDNDRDDDVEEGETKNGDILLEGEMENESIPMTFEFNDMKEEYYSGIGTLMRKLLSQSDANDLAMAISRQVTVGTVITCEDGDDVFAFATVMPLRDLQGCPAMMKVINNITSLTRPKTGTAGSKADLILQGCLTGAGIDTTGVLLHSRFSNLPLALLGALHRNLLEDLLWAQQQEDFPTQPDTGDFSRLQNILTLSLVVSDDKPSTSATTSTSTSTAAVDVTGSSSVVFDQFEDELYCQAASAAISFRPTVCKQNTLVAAILPSSALQRCVSGITELLPTT